ncbi:TetR/AcrR family transcriptional regulator [Embleya sp. NPDC056575]|uniref:TetR/AcrR family transcriptional regulator n=1 Tax=unclassified Embleya TaxID=2699296 RepID=UPI0036CD161C
MTGTTVKTTSRFGVGKSRWAMARPAGPGREALLRAGLEVADTCGLSRMSVNAVVAAAGMAKGSFYQHFADRRGYLVALHRRYHGEMEERVLAAVAGLVPGPERVIAGVHGYLDAGLATTGTRALLVQARTDPDLFEETRARNARTRELLRPELAALGWDPPDAMAHLLVAMVFDISLEELFAGRRDDLREALLALVVR